MNLDFVDLLRAFNAAEVRFLIVSAYALALHGRPRAPHSVSRITMLDELGRHNSEP